MLSASLSRPRGVKRRLPVIGLTGGVGSGKSIVAGHFASWGGVIVNGDQIGHQIISSSATVRRQLARTFGADILRGERVRRDVLAARAFADDDSVLKLNAIVHPPLIRQLNREVRRARQRTDKAAVIIDAALLAEWGIGRIEWNYLVGIWAPRRLRVRWLKGRGWSEADIRARMRRQMPWSQRRTLVDCVVKNDATLTLLERRARHCWQKMLSFSTA